MATDAIYGDHDVREQIVLHTAEVLRLKRLYNAHSPVAKLPRDILSLIFILQARAFYRENLARWHCAYNNEETSHKPIYSWVAVSQVSHHWRKVALDCPTFWTMVVLDERVAPELVRTVVTRSCGLSLSLVVDASEGYHCAGGCAFKRNPEECYGTMFRILQETLPRTSTLIMFIDTLDHGEIWDALTSLNLSDRLEDLRIEAVGWNTYSLRRGAGVKVPEDISASPPPILRRLRLQAVTLEWSNTLLCSSLRHLHLAKCQLGHEPFLGDMLTALRSMASLETLDIDSVPGPNFFDAEYEPVAMPHMRQVRVPAIAAGAHLVSLLVLPRTTCVAFFGTGKPAGSSQEASMMPAPVDYLLHMNAAMDNLLHSMVAYAISYESRDCRGRRYLGHVVPSYTRCRIWAAEGHRGDISTCDSWTSIEARPCRVTFDDMVLYSRLLQGALLTIDLRHVHTINYRDSDCDGARASVEALRGALNVSTLRISGEATFAMYAVLAGWTRPPSMSVMGDDSDNDDGPPDWIGLGDEGEDVAENADDSSLAPSSEGSNALPGDSERKHMVKSLPLFPHLRSLSFYRVDFPLTAGNDGYAFYQDMSRSFQRDYAPLYGFDVKGLVRCLRRRVAQGASPMECLDFDTCQCREREQLAPLVRAVDEVRWNGERLLLNDLDTSPVVAEEVSTITIGCRM